MAEAAGDDAGGPQMVLPLNGVVFGSDAIVGATPKFELLGVLGFAPDGAVNGHWDIKPFNEKDPLNEEASEGNVIRGRWNPQSKEVFLDEYDQDGNLTTAHINGAVDFEQRTLNCFDEDGDYWQLSFIDSPHIPDPRPEHLRISQSSSSGGSS